MITVREFSGANEEEAVQIALDTLKLTKDQVDIDVVTEKSGIFQFAKKEVVISVSFDDELLLGNRCLLFLRDLLEKMHINAKIYLIEENDEKVVIEIESPESAIIIGKNGKNLEAIQTLVNVVMNKNSSIWTKVIIDIGNYRHRKERRLHQLALKIAQQVKRTKKPVLLEPMNPFERRIIHLTLKDENNINTESEGDGNIKRVRVFYDTNS